MLRLLFFAGIKIVVLVILGLNIRRRNHLPKAGPAIVVANHNSHLDTLVLLSLFPLRLLSSIQPVAAADYFLKNKALAWFATSIIGILPIRRGKGGSGDPLQGCYEAIEQGKILILFPEGTRGEPEQLAEFKRGVAYLAERNPQVPVIPVFIHGLGKALPKNDCVLVPFFCDVFVGEALYFVTDKAGFMTLLNDKFQALASEGHFPAWE